jgi:hypothetical protein
VRPGGERRVCNCGGPCALKLLGRSGVLLDWSEAGHVLARLCDEVGWVCCRGL